MLLANCDKGCPENNGEEHGIAARLEPIVRPRTHRECRLNLATVRACGPRRRCDRAADPMVLFRPKPERESGNCCQWIGRCCMDASNDRCIMSHSRFEVVLRFV